MTHTTKSIVTTTRTGARTLVASLLLLMTVLPAAACIWSGTHNFYLYSLYDSREFRDRAEETCNANWRTYLGVVEDVNYYYYFDMDAAKDYAAKHADQLMSSYLENLDLYLGCAREVSNERWDYPTKEQLDKRRETLLQVRTYALGKLKTKLRSQHALLFMRCNMLLGRHAENVVFWEETAMHYIWTIYKDMMRDIYAGALLHNGRADDATQIFAELGDWQSLMTQFYERRSFKAISEEYNRDPNSAVLPFLLQDFVNNVQEAVDVKDEFLPAGKLFIRDIQKNEAMQMCQLARKVVSEKRSQQPVMWQSALAWIEFLFGNEMLARADIARTATMEGTQRMKDCARVLRLYINAATTAKNSADFDSHLTQELQWLDDMGKEQGFFNGAKDRLIHQVLTKHYNNAGRTCTALALLSTVDAYDVKERIDTMSIAALKNLFSYVSTLGHTPIDEYAAPALKLDATAMNDLMGTKYLRLCQWKEAKEWLKKVPASYYSEKGYAPYAYYRSWAVEPWDRRQWLKESVVYSDAPVTLRLNPKMAFAAEMEQMEGELNVLTGTARQQRCYELAVRYAQASYTGDCWFLMRDGKSAGDTLRTNETDLLARARDLLRQASMATDQRLKERVLFALAYGELYTESQRWSSWEWDSDAREYVLTPHTEALQYKAFATLATFANYSTTPESDYVSRCDEYLQFKKRWTRR